MTSDCSPHLIDLGGIPLGINETTKLVSCCDNAETRRNIGLDPSTSEIPEFLAVSISDAKNGKDDNFSPHFLSALFLKKNNWTDLFTEKKSFYITFLNRLGGAHDFQGALAKEQILL